MSEDDSKKLPVKRGDTRIAKAPTGKRGSFLENVRGAKAPAPMAAAKPAQSDPAMIAAALKPRARRPRLVFALDATASREPAWEAAKATTDALCQALPGQLDVALAVHGGSRLRVFTEFVSEPGPLRDQAAGIQCEAGETRLLDIMERTRDAGDVKVLVYIGDVFEESVEGAESLAAALRLRGTRIIILHDAANALTVERSRAVFERIAKITGGAVLPFDASAVDKLRAMLEAISTLAVGGMKLLEQRAAALPAAATLLRQLSDGEDEA
jgi:voltage-gated potassium channel Kch